MAINILANDPNNPNPQVKQPVVNGLPTFVNGSWTTGQTDSSPTPLKSGGSIPATTTPTAGSSQPSQSPATPPITDFQYGAGATPTDIRPGDVTPGQGLTSVGGKTDMRSMLTGTFQRYGLDANNPGLGLGNIDYFLRRTAETNPNDVQYWTKRLAQEIEKAKYGTVGDLIDTGGGGGASGASSGAGAGGGESVGTSSEQFTSGPMWDLIQSQLQQNTQPVSAQDPNILAATGAMKVGLDSSQRDARTALAQRSAAEGTNYGGEGSGAFDTALQSQYEKEGSQLGQFGAQQTINEIQARRQMVISLLGAAQGEQRLALQQTLANLDNQLRQQSINNQNNQAYDQLGLRSAEDTQNYNLDYARLLAGL